MWTVGTVDQTNDKRPAIPCHLLETRRLTTSVSRVLPAA